MSKINQEQKYYNEAETATKVAGGVIGAITGVSLSHEENSLGVKAMHGVIGSGIGVGVLHNLFKNFYGKYAEIRMEAYEKKERARLNSSIYLKIQERFSETKKEDLHNDLNEYDIKELSVLEHTLNTSNIAMSSRSLEEQFYINSLFQKIKKSNTYLRNLIIGNQTV